MGKIIAIGVVLLAVIVGSVWLFLYLKSEVVPPGTTVILLHANKPSEIYQEGLYSVWGRTKKYFVDTKLKSYSHEMEILCVDNINMAVRVKWIGSFWVTKESLDIIKKKVKPVEVNTGDIKGYQLSLDKFFTDTMRDILEGISRDVVSKYNTNNIRQNRKVIRTTIKQKFITRLKELNYPVETTDVLVTNLDYPPEVTKKRNDIKQADLKDLKNAAIAKANVAKSERDAELKAEQGKAKLVEANAKAACNKVRAASLTDRVIRYKKLLMMKGFATGENNMVVMIPFDTSKLAAREEVQRTLEDSLKENLELLEKYTPKKIEDPNAVSTEVGAGVS